MKRILSILALLTFCAPVVQAQAATPVVTITWVAPTQNVDLTPITAPLTYQLYIGKSGAEVKSGSPLAATSFTLTPSPAPGTQVCVKVTAIANGVESAQSGEACATMPFPAPNSPTVVSIVIK